MNLSLNQTLQTLCSVWDKLGWLNWFWKFHCEGLSSFNPKRFYYSFAWYYSLCERLPFAHDLSLEASADSDLCFWMTLLHSVSYVFFVYRSPCSSLGTVFNSISPNIDDVLSINTSANMFVFGDFNVHHKDWLTYSGGTDRSGETTLPR